MNQQCVVYNFRPLQGTTVRDGASLENTRLHNSLRVGLLPPSWVGFSRPDKEPHFSESSGRAPNASKQLAGMGRVEKTPYYAFAGGSVWCRHLRWGFPSRARNLVWVSRPDSFQMRPNDLRGKGRAEKQLFTRFPGIGFMPPSWVGFSLPRKKPRLGESSLRVSNMSKRLAGMGLVELTPVYAFPRGSLWCRHLGWVFPATTRNLVSVSRPDAISNPSKRLASEHLFTPLTKICGDWLDEQIWVGFSSQRKERRLSDSSGHGSNASKSRENTILREWKKSDKQNCLLLIR